MTGDGRLVSVDAVQRTLQAVKALRFNVASAFDHLAAGLGPSMNPNKDNDNAAQFLEKIKRDFNKIDVAMRNLEAVSEKMVPVVGPMSLSNGGMLSLDPTNGRPALYLQMIESYKWTDKMRAMSSHAHSILIKNDIKRTKKRVNPREQKQQQQLRPALEAISIQSIDDAIKAYRRSLPDFKMEVARPYGSSSILQVTLGKTLKAVLILRNIVVEHIVVKAYSEEFLTENGQVDMWSSSRYKVFQKITDYATVAMINYSGKPSIHLKMLLFWLRNYGTLFSAKCHRCGRHLKDFLPPTVRDLHNFTPYHDGC